MARQLKCPSCGASVKFRRGVQSVTCQYCGNSILVPDYTETPLEASGKAAVFPGRTCSGTFAAILVIGILLTGALSFYIYSAAGPGTESVKAIGVISDSEELDESPVVMEFGRSGTAPGCFQDAECIAIDGEGLIYVGERETGRVQIFDVNGSFVSQWFFADGDTYLSSMSVNRDGVAYLVYDSELYVYNGGTGELIDSLQHPEGWGFDDVDTAPDGSILAAWYKSGDDIIRFDSGGKITLLVENAVSTNTGESELNTMVAAGNLGEFFAFGSFNSVVLSFNPDGRFVDRFGNDDMFVIPEGMDVDSEGRLWISDFGNLMLFSSSGELLGTIDPGVSVKDFVIDSNNQLFGITMDGTVAQLDLSSY